MHILGKKKIKKKINQLRNQGCLKNGQHVYCVFVWFPWSLPLRAQLNATVQQMGDVWE